MEGIIRDALPDGEVRGARSHRFWGNCVGGQGGSVQGNTKENSKKLRILFRGWINIAHSYAIVNCFQLIHLYKNYNDKIEFYVEEMPYFQPHWNNVKKLIYKDEYNEILKNLRVWDGEDIDLVYSITYPYNINMLTVNNKIIPKCVFYTSEFASLNEQYFTLDNLNNSNGHQIIVDHIKNNPKLFMTAPSIWSAKGMGVYDLPSDKNRIITHGVDSTIFNLHNKSSMTRNNIRKFYKIKDDDIFLVNIGAMTQNKGIVLVLQCLNILVNKLQKKHYKLLLKGTGDLYKSKNFLEIYFEHLQAAKAITREEMDNLLTNHIIFTDKTLSYSKINDIFNAADLMMSPYLAEGFNLTSLEGLSAGLPVLIPKTGSTKEYIEDIYKNGGDKFIMYVESNVIDTGNAMLQNNITIENIINTLLNNEGRIQSMKSERHMYHNKMSKYIEENYSWNKVSELLFDYFNEII
jgi:glycosyltransferase involved in cell wall biosynthesis